MHLHGVRYLVDEDGHEVGVVLTMDTYRELLAELEELESLRAFDAAKAERGADAEAVDLLEPLEEIERAPLSYRATVLRRAQKELVALPSFAAASPGLAQLTQKPRGTLKRELLVGSPATLNGDGRRPQFQGGAHHLGQR